MGADEHTTIFTACSFFQWFTRRSIEFVVTLTADRGSFSPPFQFSKNIQLITLRWFQFKLNAQPFFAMATKRTKGVPLNATIWKSEIKLITCAVLFERCHCSLDPKF